MKKKFLIFIALIAVAACNKPEEGKVTPTPGPTPTPTEQIVIPSSVDTKPVVSSEGGDTKISFTAAAAWTASVINTKADSWVDVNPKNGNAGSAEITIKTTANDTYVERNATIQIKCGTATKDIVLTQKQLDNITVTTDKVELGAEGGTFTIVLKSNIDYKYEISGDWIKESATKAYTENTLTFSADPNDDVAKREGSVTIKGGKFTETVKVYQSGVEPSLVITQNEYNLEAEGGSIVVEVVSNVQVKMTIPGEADWITENQTKSVSTSTFHLDVAANDTYESRSAEITFSNEEAGLSENVTIIQAEKIFYYPLVKKISDYHSSTKSYVYLSFEYDSKNRITKCIEESTRPKQPTLVALFNYEHYSDGNGSIDASGSAVGEVIKLWMKDGLCYEYNRSSFEYEGNHLTKWNASENFWVSYVWEGEVICEEIAYVNGRTIPTTVEYSDDNNPFSDQPFNLYEYLSSGTSGNYWNLFGFCGVEPNKLPTNCECKYEEELITEIVHQKSEIETNVIYFEYY